MTNEYLPQLLGGRLPAAYSRAGRELSRQLDALRAQEAAETAQVQAEARVSAARVASASFVAQVGMRHVGMAADTEERLLRQHPYPAHAARLSTIVDGLAALASDEITLLSLRARRSSGR
jgi:hypothetical protein